MEYDSDVFSRLHFRLQKSPSQTGLLTIASNNTTGLISYKENMVYFSSMLGVKSWGTTSGIRLYCWHSPKETKDIKRENKHTYVLDSPNLVLSSSPNSLFIETELHYVAQAGPQLMILSSLLDNFIN